MDEFLPSEMLAKIASNLSYKDVNSLLRTSKTAHAKLIPYRHILPKIPCRLDFECESDKICLQAVFGRRVKKTNFYDRIVNGADELTEEENRDRVVRFYKSCGDARVEERTFQGRLEGLSLHIQIIKSFASIKSICLNKVDDDLILEELARLMGQSQSRIDRILIFYPKEFSSNLEFITACKPRSLEVSRPAQLPDNFYNLPVIQKLTDLNLNDLSAEKTVHNLSLLSATNIFFIYGPHNIAIDDVEQILIVCQECESRDYGNINILGPRVCELIQWAESKRRISLIVFDFNNTLNKQKCMEWIEHLDNSLFEVKPDIHERMTWVLTRRCDCTKIKFECSRKFLVIRSAV